MRAEKEQLSDCVGRRGWRRDGGNLCPGMFNAVNGLGAGGQVDPAPSDNALTALYATFSMVGFFEGTFANRLGIRITLAYRTPSRKEGEKRMKRGMQKLE